jgi:hypothetical protein
MMIIIQGMVPIKKTNNATVKIISLRMQNSIIDKKPQTNNINQPVHISLLSNLQHLSLANVM